MKRLSFHIWVDWVFLGLLTFLGWRIVSQGDKLTDSVMELNLKVGQVIYKISDLEEDSKRTERRVERLEQLRLKNMEKDNN